MKYQKIVHGIFIDRPNRFIAHVEIEGKIETVHVKNTGRCAELLVPHAHVILEDFRNQSGSEKRRTKFDLIAVYKILSENHPLKKISPLLINMDSQAPNKVVKEWLNSQDYDFVKPEFVYGKSRIDFYMEKQINDEKGTHLQKYLMEIKGCTLERDGCGFFPDAPTERGVKHLNELAAASKNGFKCIIGFVIQMKGINQVLANEDTHPEFGDALEQAKKAGVQIYYFCCDVDEDALRIEKLIVLNK